MKIEFTGSPLEIRHEMTVCLGTFLSTGGTTSAPAVAPKTETPKAEKVKAEPKSAAAAEVAVTATPANTEVTATLLGTEIPKKVKSAGRDTVVALLAKYDAKKGSELKPEQYSAFYAELVQLA